jgi:excisionase family DNA binding protein
MQQDEERPPFNIIIALLAVRHLMTVDELAEILRKSPCTVYRMARKKQMPSIMINGSRMSDPSTIAMWLIKKEPQLAVAARWLAKGRLNPMTI